MLRMRIQPSVQVIPLATSYSTSLVFHIYAMSYQSVTPKQDDLGGTACPLVSKYKSLLCNLHCSEAAVLLKQSAVTALHSEQQLEHFSAKNALVKITPPSRIQTVLCWQSLRGLNRVLLEGSHDS